MLIEMAARAVKTRRGDFYPLSDYGSDLHKISKGPRALYALCAARRALAREDGIYPVSAQQTDTGYNFTVLLNGKERQVSVSL